jgi:LacI family transcriptional regulator
MWLRDWKGDGIIARIQNPAIAAEVRRTGLSVVDVLGNVRDAGFPLVHVDDREVGRAAAEHLLERGFRRFGYVGIGEPWSDQRRSAFAQAIEPRGFHVARYELARAAGQAGWDAVQAGLCAWIAGLPKPVGIMVCSDERGPWLLEACRRVGARVPDDVAVIGVDDDDALCAVSDPPLSTVAPAHDHVGYHAAALLERLMRHEPAPPQPYLVGLRGVVTRASTDVLAIEDRNVAEALRFIREKACDGIGVDDVARRAAMSRSVLQRRFRAVLGRSVHDEILRRKLTRAQELLAESDLPIQIVAERTGFRHPEYMGVLFKAQLGTTPARWRKARRKK